MTNGDELKYLKLSNSGNLIAICNSHGTYIEVKNTRDGKLVHRFYRGAQSAVILQMLFSPSDIYLGILSYKPEVSLSDLTLHIFKVNNEKESIQKEEEGKGFFNSWKTTFSSYTKSNYLNSENRFAVHHIQ